MPTVGLCSLYQKYSACGRSDGWDVVWARIGVVEAVCTLRSRFGPIFKYVVAKLWSKVILRREHSVHPGHARTYNLAGGLFFSVGTGSITAEGQ
jgi:hypothetical protein